MPQRYIDPARHSVGSIFVESRHLFVDHFVQLARIGGLLVGFWYLLISFIPMKITASPSIGGVHSFQLVVDGGQGLILTQAALSVLLALGGIIMTIAVFMYLLRLIEGKQIDTEQLIWEALHKSPLVIGTALLQLVLLVVLYLLLIIPGVIFTVFWIFTLYVVVYYDKGRMAALDESKSIVRGRRRKTLGYIILLYTPLFVLSYIFQAAVIKLYALYGRHLLIDLLHNIASFVIQLFYAVVMSLFFLHRNQTRKHPKRN